MSRHAYFRQNADGWGVTSGHGIDAGADSIGRVHTVNYQVPLVWTNWGAGAGGDQTTKATVHEHGHHIVIDVAASAVDKACTAATITSSALPKALRPKAAKMGTVCVVNNATEVIGTYTVSTGGVITISNGVAGTNFAAAAGGFHQFTIEYDRRT
jgi:hypothetical protein